VVVALFMALTVAGCAGGGDQGASGANPTPSVGTGTGHGSQPTGGGKSTNCAADPL